MPLIIILIIIAVFIVFGGLRVVNQYDRGVVLTFGKYTGTRMPGLTWIFPLTQRMILVDIRINTADIPQQEAITKDNVPVGINAVVYFKVEKAEDAILKVKNYTRAISQYAMAALRDVIGGVELDELLVARDKIASEIKNIIDQTTSEWGVDVSAIKIQDIEIPADMKRAMAKQAESERERRAIIIKAQGEAEAAENIAKAAAILKDIPGGISLRTLQTIEKLQPDPSKMTVFALPIELMSGLETLAKMKGNGK
ncbi:MAG: SPFH domain-containing protein [bacterium]